MTIMLVIANHLTGKKKHKNATCLKCRTSVVLFFDFWGRGSMWKWITDTMCGVLRIGNSVLPTWLDEGHEPALFVSLNSSIALYLHYWWFHSDIKLSSRLGLKNTPTAPLQWGKTPNECPVHDTKQSDDEVPVMLELWGMQSTSSLSFLPGPPWPWVVAPDNCPIYGLSRIKPWFHDFTDFCILTAYLCKTKLFEIELFWHLNCVLMLN